MIVYNGKKLDTSDKTDPFVKLYNDQIAELDRRKQKYFTFTFPKKKIRFNDEGHEETPAGALIKFRQTYKTPVGEFDVLYYKTSHFDKHNREQYRPRYFDFKGTVFYEWATNKDLIWWLIYVCPHMETILGMEHKLNLDRGTPYYKLVDRVRDAEDQYEIMKKVADVQLAIFSKDIGLREDDLRYVAKSVGIRGVDDMTESMLRVELGNKILRQRSDGSYDMKQLENFKQSLPDSRFKSTEELVRAKAVLQELKDWDMFTTAVDDKTNQHIWRVKGANNILAKCPTGNYTERDNAVIDKLAADKEVRDKVEAMIAKVKEESQGDSIQS